MGFVEAIQSCLGKYATFRGRASRSEFWFFYLFVMIAAIVASIIDTILGTGFSFPNAVTGTVTKLPYGYVYVATVLALFLPQISVLVRRLHDRDKSGWYYFLFLVPLVGFIILLIWFCSRGTHGGNRYGADPLMDSYADTFS